MLIGNSPKTICCIVVNLLIFRLISAFVEVLHDKPS